MASADLLLHPVRLRIVEAFLGDRALTTVALRSELPDVPLASRYRHVARLVDAGVLAIVAERRVRGALERTYTLRLSAAQLSAADVARMTPDDHRQAFMAFTAGLLGDFDRYLARGGSDLARDGVGYRMAAMWLSELEYVAFLRELSAVVQSYMTKPPTPGRRRRILRTILIPGAEDLGQPLRRHRAVTPGNRFGALRKQSQSMGGGGRPNVRGHRAIAIADGAQIIIGSSSVGTSISAPSAACVKLIGTSQITSSPSREKISCGFTRISQYRSPRCRPSSPGSPPP